MKLEEIEAFLTVVECGSITMAAQYLFITQGAVSQRIKQLESELGFCLMNRGKGHRSITLTVQGEEFIPIAQQWVALWKNTQQLKFKNAKYRLSIGSVDLVNNVTLLPLYKKHLQSHPEIKLKIATHHSNEIYNLLENRDIDMGFVFSQIHYPNIISTPIYREQMYLICHKDSEYIENIAPQDLLPQKEIYLRWGADYEIWHDQHWRNGQSFVVVNTGSMLPQYLDEPNYWAIAPMSLVAFLKEKYPIKYHRLSIMPPPRICYQLTHRYPKNSSIDAIELFKEEIKEFVQVNNDICTFEPWMLE